MSEVLRLCCALVQSEEMPSFEPPPHRPARLQSEAVRLGNHPCHPASVGVAAWHLTAHPSRWSNAWACRRALGGLPAVCRKYCANCCARRRKGRQKKRSRAARAREIASGMVSRILYGTGKGMCLLVCSRRKRVKERDHASSRNRRMRCSADGLGDAFPPQRSDLLAGGHRAGDQHVSGAIRRRCVSRCRTAHALWPSASRDHAPR